MPCRRVHCSAEIAVAPERIWALLRDFCAPWHPLVTQMTAETTATGGLVRRFTVAGDAAVYRELRTYFSDSDRMMAYTHLAGIAGVTRYDAYLSVAATQTGARVTMGAELTAPMPRADEIAAGTEAVFDAGLAALADMDLPKPNAGPIAEPIAEPIAGPIAAPRADQGAAFEWAEGVVPGAPAIAYTSGGAAAGDLCLFLHGIGGNRTNWAAQMAALARFAPVAALDLRGYGGSELGSGPSDVDGYCADILRLMDHMGVERVILCGLSYGAWIATSFAMRHGDRLAGLILSGGCTGMSEADAAERDAFRQSREEPLNAGQTPADFAPAVVDVIAGPGATDAVRHILHEAMAAIPVATYADALRCFTAPSERFDFAKITMPVMLMTGEHDRLAPPHEIRSVAARIRDQSPAPDVCFEVIAGAGHVCNIENPAAYNPHLIGFVQRIRRCWH